MLIYGNLIYRNLVQNLTIHLREMNVTLIWVDPNLLTFTINQEIETIVNPEPLLVVQI